jgi:hypothetical protein
MYLLDSDNIGVNIVQSGNLKYWYAVDHDSGKRILNGKKEKKRNVIHD